MAAKCVKSVLPRLAALRVGTWSLSSTCISSLKSPAIAQTSFLAQQAHDFHSSVPVHGGKKKSIWRQNRVPAHTRLRLDKPEKIKVKKAYGGHRKIKAYKLNKGLYFWKSIDVELECPILKVVHNTANKDFNKLGIMVKGTIVKVDPDPFKTWYNEYFNKEEESSSELQSSIQNLQPYMDSGKLYAKITTRPGQVGVCNGYILEGEELETFLDNRQDLRVSQGV